MAKNKKQLDSEKKLELARKIASKSDSIKSTYGKAEGILVKVFRFFSNWFDRILFNQRFAKLIAVSLGALLVLFVTGNNDNTLFKNSLESASKIDDIVVTSNISDTVYEVSGLPETASVTITGDTNDVQSVTSSTSNLQVMADLANLDEGTHEVNLTPVNFSSKVDVSVEPSSAVVTIKKKISKSFKVGYDFINQNKLDDIYVLGEPKFSQSEVIVRCSEDTMNQIAFVKALIDVNGVKADFEKEATLVAYNQKGEQVAVDILPNTLSVNVSVSSPHKEVEINLIPEGKLANGKAVESYTLDNETVTIYGKESVLDKIDSIDVSVPVAKISKDTKITTPIVLPNGVQKASINKVSIDLKVVDATSKVIDDIPLTIINHDKFEASVNSESEKYSVTISGAKSVLDTINAPDITIVANMKSYDAIGSYDVNIKVSGKNKLASYSIDEKSVKVVLSYKGE